MRLSYSLLLCAIFLLGCARVRVEAPKEPIKMDIAVRLDIYQHVEKDIDAIENIVSGPSEKKKADDEQGLLDCFINEVYAQDLAPEVEKAALRRKSRYAQITSWQKEGAAGENRLGLLEVRSPSGTGNSIIEVTKAENNDRMIIYKSIAKKNNIAVEEVQELYAERLREKAPSGTPIEVLNSYGGYEWRTK